MRISLGVCFLAVAAVALATPSMGATYYYVGGDFGLREKVDDGAWTDITLTGTKTVNTMDVAPNDCGVYIGGDFDKFGDAEESSGAVFHSTKETVGLNVVGKVHVIRHRTMATAVVGGEFDEIDGMKGVANAAFFGKCNGAEALGSGFDDIVYAVSPGAPNTYVGGKFSGVKNGATVEPNTKHLALYNSVDENLTNLGSGPDPYPFDAAVKGVATLGNSVFAGGDFTASSATAVLGFAEYNNGWSEPAGYTGVAGNVVSSLAATSTHIIVAGTLSSAVATPTDCGLGHYDPSTNTMSWATSTFCTAAGFANGDIVSVFTKASSPGLIYIVGGADNQVAVATVSGADFELDSTLTTAFDGGVPTGGSAYAALSVDDPGANDSMCACGTGSTGSASLVVPSVFASVFVLLFAIVFRA